VGGADMAMGFMVKRFLFCISWLGWSSQIDIFFGALSFLYQWSEYMAFYEFDAWYRLFSLLSLIVVCGIG
jgi:hypothetical protein